MSLKKQQTSPLGLYAIGIAALFLLGFFLLLVFGAGSYRSAVTAQSANGDERVLLSYVSTCVSAADCEGAVEIRAQDDSSMLIVHDAHSEYAQRVYLWGGQLLEDFALPDDPLNPEDAEVIGKTDTFSVEKIGGRLLAVSTDAGRALVYVRSAGGVL